MERRKLKGMSILVFWTKYWSAITKFKKRNLLVLFDFFFIFYIFFHSHHDVVVGSRSWCVPEVPLHFPDATVGRHHIQFREEILNESLEIPYRDSVWASLMTQHTSMWRSSSCQIVRNISEVAVALCPWFAASKCSDPVKVGMHKHCL